LRRQTSIMSKAKKKSSVVTLEPEAELVFNIPKSVEKQNKGVESLLVITNPTDDAIMFKVKTTAPKKYCVKPNAGELPAGKNVTVKVVLQATSVQGSEPCKDKFLVQTVLKADAKVWEKDAVWKETAKEHFMENKMKCKWEFEGAPAADAATPAATAQALKTATKAAAPATAASQPAKKAETKAAPAPTKRAVASKPAAPAATKTAVAATADQAQIQQASMYLLFIAFIFGVICGKFLL